MYIYKITNFKTGKSYIGKSQSEEPTYMGSGLLLWNSYRKNFCRDDLDPRYKTHHKWVYDKNQEAQIYEKTILEKCDDAQILCDLEKQYIKQYNTIRPNGYNIAEGGEGGCLILGYTEQEKEAWRHKISLATKEAMQRPEVRDRFLKATRNKSDEWRKHISESLTGKKGTPMSAEQKERLRLRNLGNKYGIGNRSRTGMHNTSETNKKISEAHKQIAHTKEWNEKVSKSLKGKHKSEAHKQALRKPKPKYKWQLPDGSIKIMDASNGSRHEGWIKLERVS